MTQDAAHELTSEWPTLLASAIGLTFSVGTIGLYTFGVFIAPLEAAFGWSRGAISGGVLAFQLSVAIAAPLYGALIDRFGVRRVILTSIPLLGLTVAALGLQAGGLWQFYFTLALVPLLAGGASPIGYAQVLVQRFDAARGLALGLALAGVGLGAAILPPLTQTLITMWDWRTAYMALGAITVALTFPFCWLLLHTELPPSKTERAQATIADYLAQPLFISLVFVFLLVGMVTVAAVTHLVPLLMSHGVSPAESAAMAAIVGVAVIVGRGLIGFAIDRYAAPRIFVGVLGLFMLALVLLALDPSRTRAAVAAFLIGFAVGAEVDIVAFLVSRYYPAAAFSRLYGIIFGMFMAASGVGPMALGLAFDATGDYRLGLGVMGLMTVTAMILSSRLPQTQNRP